MLLDQQLSKIDFDFSMKVQMSLRVYIMFDLCVTIV